MGKVREMSVSPVLDIPTPSSAPTVQVEYFEYVVFHWSRLAPRMRARGRWQLQL